MFNYNKIDIYYFSYTEFRMLINTSFCYTLITLRVICHTYSLPHLWAISVLQ